MKITLSFHFLMSMNHSAMQTKTYQHGLLDPNEQRWHKEIRQMPNGS